MQCRGRRGIQGSQPPPGPGLHGQSAGQRETAWLEGAGRRTVSPLLLGMSTSPPRAFRDLIICAVIVESPCNTAMCSGVLPVKACTPQPPGVSIGVVGVYWGWQAWQC